MGRADARARARVLAREGQDGALHGAPLLNRDVQRAQADWGELYPWNAAGDAEPREALPPGAWDCTTRAVRAAVRTAWPRRADLPRGAPRLVRLPTFPERAARASSRSRSTPKPWTRYVDPELFPMPYAREPRTPRVTISLPSHLASRPPRDSALANPGARAAWSPRPRTTAACGSTSLDPATCQRAARASAESGIALATVRTRGRL